LNNNKKVVFSLKKLFDHMRSTLRRKLASRKGSAAYWTVNMVVNETFNSPEDSLRHFHWRNAQYPGYIDLMPVRGHDGKIVLDYGCGPGNDLVGFSVFSEVKKLYAVDVSPTALEAAKKRLSLHNKHADFIKIDENENIIPIPSNSVDYIHASGVLHHCANLNLVLSELHRILKNDGRMSVMVYNYSSIWLHLYVAYIQQLYYGRFKEEPLLEAFRKSTDGGYCPVSHCYAPDSFLALMQQHGFKGEFRGAAISLMEMKILEKRFDAIADRRLDEEHRDFLSELTFNEKGIPLYRGSVAGIDACYLFEK
jgi:ubiquinone/menaquinone biosynthesis C-methylase UbiE